MLLDSQGESQVARGAKTGNEILAPCGMHGAENEICLDGELNRRTVLVRLRFFILSNAKPSFLHLYGVLWGFGCRKRSLKWFIKEISIIRLLLEKAVKSKAVP